MIRLLVVGGGGVGKSGLIKQFVTDCFYELYCPTLEDTFRKQLLVDETLWLLEIVEVSPDVFTEFRDFFVLSHGFVIMYSITERSTFGAITDYRNQIMKIKETDSLPMTLVGNKCDRETCRQVSQLEGLQLATSFGCPYFETSAKLKVNVDEIFEELVRETRHLVPKPVVSSEPKTNKKKQCFLM